MTVPGFTADSSLCSTAVTYQGKALLKGAGVVDVVPMQSFLRLGPNVFKYCCEGNTQICVSCPNHCSCLPGQAYCICPGGGGIAGGFGAMAALARGPR